MKKLREKAIDTFTVSIYTLLGSYADLKNCLAIHGSLAPSKTVHLR